MEVEIPHLCHHHGLADEAFTLDLEGVESVRAVTWEIWPGPPPEHEGKPRDEQTRLVEEYQSKWREESVDWTEFESILAQGSFEVSNADFVRNDQVIGLRVGGWMREGPVEGKAFEFTIRASRIAIRHGEDQRIDLEQFVKLGGDYWDDWSRGRPDLGKPVT